MAVVLVLHELRSKQRSLEMFESLRATHPISLKLTDSACAIHTFLEPAQLLETLKAFVRANDKLFLLPLTKPYTGYGPREKSAWLSDYLD